MFWTKKSTFVHKRKIMLIFKDRAERCMASYNSHWTRPPFHVKAFREVPDMLLFFVFPFLK